MARIAAFPKWSLTSWLLLAGTLALTFFLGVPSWTASRLARIETRAEESARILLAVASSLESDPLTDSALEPLLVEVRRRGQALSHPESALLTLSGIKPGAAKGRPSDAQPARFFASRHYLFQLTRTPVNAYGDGGIAKSGPLEVLAWPRTALSGAKTAFFMPEDDHAVYSRNLGAGYLGFERVPRPGQARARIDPAKEGSLREGKRDNWYRGYDDERWIDLPVR